MSDDPIESHHPSPLQIAAACIRLAEDFRMLVVNYAELHIQSIEERKKSTERMDRLIVELIRSGAISRDPTIPPDT